MNKEDFISIIHKEIDDRFDYMVHNYGVTTPETPENIEVGRLMDDLKKFDGFDNYNPDRYSYLFNKILIKYLLEQ